MLGSMTGLDWVSGVGWNMLGMKTIALPCKILHNPFIVI